MPNLPAAKKALRSSKRKTARNKKVKDQVSRITKKTLKLIEMGDVALARQQLPKAYKALDKAAENGVMHPNASARKKSQLEKKLNSAAQHFKTAQKNS
jgi:small subunit ribosomal protein S20